MSHWLYQFQMFAFTTAKYWGYGPRSWTASELGFDRPNVFEFGPSPEGLRYLTGSQTADHDLSAPSQLCRWTIHTTSSDDICSRYENPWQPQWKTPPIQERLRDALEHTDFTKINPNDLPVAISLIAKKAQRSPNELLLESIGFAIMGRNPQLVYDLLDEAQNGKIPIHTLFPLHLAINYLDGSEACCEIFDNITEHILNQYGYNILMSLHINDNGYTWMDSLMIAIVKSHTNLPPSALDDTNKEKRFPGDGVSICGRWDADSDCIRALLSSGSSGIPFDWKHKFCHTSAQAICHIIQRIDWRFLKRKWVSSGLFVKRCTNCGLKLELTPLHTLVYITFMLAEYGCEDEDLFGMIACLLSFLSFLETPIPSVQVSFHLLFDCDADSMEICTHQESSPPEFAAGLRSYRTHDWSEKCETGWALFQIVLDRSQETYKFLDVEEYEEVCSMHVTTPLTIDQILATIWAAVQTELLTYRRLDLNDPWVSEHFNMAELLQSLQTEGKLSIGLIEKGLMKQPICRCGQYVDFGCAEAEDTTTRNFSNLENSDRAIYLIRDECD